MADRGTATATIVFTDVVGSTQVRSHLGEIEADRLFREHERTLTEVVTTHQGRVVKAAGDGIMATFDAASDAVAAAVSMQRRVSQPALHHGGGADLQLRIGIAAGDVSWEDGDCFGLPVVIAARLEADADGRADPGEPRRPLARRRPRRHLVRRPRAAGRARPRPRPRRVRGLVGAGHRASDRAGRLGRAPRRAGDAVDVPVRRPHAGVGRAGRGVGRGPGRWQPGRAHRR